MYIYSNLNIFWSFTSITIQSWCHPDLGFINIWFGYHFWKLCLPKVTLVQITPIDYLLELNNNQKRSVTRSQVPLLYFICKYNRHNTIIIGRFERIPDELTKLLHWSSSRLNAAPQIYLVLRFGCPMSSN